MAEAELIENVQPLPFQPAPVRKRPWWKRIIRFFFWTGGILTFLLLLLVLLTYIYQDEVKGYVIAEINKRVNTTVIVDPKNIDLTIIRSFPDVSIDFNDIAALDATPAKRDTLLKAGKISLAFNLLDLFRHNYTIRNISMSDAKVNVWVDEKGRDNFHFLKETTDTVKSDTSHVAFALEKILLTNVSCSYSDKKSKNFYRGNFRELNFTGNFGKEKYDFGADADFVIGDIKTGGHSYFKGNNGKLDLEMEIDNTSGTYSIKTAKVRLQDLKANVSGNVRKTEKNYLLDLAVKGEEIDLPAALSLLPASYQPDVQDLESTGEFYIDGTVKGTYSDSLMPAVNARFGINDGATIARKDGSVKLTNVSLKGIFSSEKGKEGVQLQSFSASTSKSRFAGSFGMSGFSHPSYAVKISGRVDLEEMQNILRIDTIEQASGTLELEVQGSGSPTKGSEFSVADFRKLKTSGMARMTAVRMKLKGARYPVDSVNGKLAFDGNNVTVEGFTARTAKSDVRIDGTVSNLPGYLFTDREVLNVNGNLYSSAINLDSLFATDPKSKDTSTYHATLPERIKFSLSASVKHLQMGKFEASQISGDVKLNNRRLIADPLSFNSMDGSFSGSGMIDGTSGDSLLMTCNADIKNVNISRLFLELNNFGQGRDTVITNNNVRGRVNAHVNFASLWGSDLKVNEKKIYTDADITLGQGELINFLPLQVLSHFIKVDELRDIKFQELHNNIQIRNRVITIPKMEIKSSAINVSMYGTHNFDNVVDYHFTILLDDLRAKRAKAAKKENSEFGEEIEEGGGHRTRLFVTMKGPIDNPTMAYYKVQDAFKAFKEDLHQEGKNLKQILHEEWGWFKDDKDKQGNKDRKKDDSDGKFILQQNDPPKKDKKKTKDENLDDSGDY